jgi:hypothetical protein
MGKKFIGCTLKRLPKEKSLPLPQYIAAMRDKYWGKEGVKLTVSFPFDNPDKSLRDKILLHLNAWGKGPNVSFVETSGTGQVRIARTRGDGYWSYLGRDILQIPKNRPTMNLDGFTMSTRDSEFYRVVRHEAGHTLGFPHEHMRKELVARLDVQKTIRYFRETQGWSEQEVYQQVLTPLNEASLLSTPADQTSVMCYQLPAEITKDHKPIMGGNDINASDLAFAGDIYPGTVQPPPPPPPPTGDVPTTMVILGRTGAELSRYKLTRVT